MKKMFAIVMMISLMVAQVCFAGTVTLSMLFASGKTPDKITIDKLPTSTNAVTTYLDFDIDGSYANPVFAAQSAITAGQELGTVASDGDIVDGAVFPSNGNKITINVTTSTTLFPAGEYLLTLWDFPEAIGAKVFCLDSNANEVKCSQRVRQY
jgi:hypothetical protein